MTLLLGAVLVVPLLAAVALVPLSRASTAPARQVAGGVVPVTGALVASGWAVIASAVDPPTWDRIVATPSVAVAAAGVALVVAATAPSRLVGRSTSLTGLALFGAVAGVDGVDLPDRSLAVSVVGLAFFIVVGGVDTRRGAIALSTIGAGAVAVGLVLENPDDGAQVAVAGMALVLVVAMRTAESVRPLAAPLLPALVLGVHVIVAAAPRTEDVDRIGFAGAALGLVASAALVLFRASAANPWRLSLAVVGAGVVILTQDLPDAGSAGILLVAGGVLAVASGHPVALVGALPGLTASLVVFGAATEPVHAAAGAAAVLLLLVACAGAPRDLVVPAGRADRAFVVAAVAFGVVPLWGWSGIEVPDHVIGVGAGSAAALLVTVALSLPLPRGWSRGTGRITGRRDTAAAPSHGITIPEAVSEVPPEEVVVPEVPILEDRDEEVASEEEVDDHGGPEQTGTTQHPVAIPPQPVLGRARVRGTPLRGGVRARSGRTP